MRPSFKEVPEEWKAPAGPYHQAPLEYGGEWWLVNPFTTAEPWLFAEKRTTISPLPEGFVEIFGERPRTRDFQGIPRANWTYRVAVTQWEQDLRYFKRAGFPDWATSDERRQSDEIFIAWGMRAPRYYESRYGWMARFVDSEIPDHDISAWTALHWSHGSVVHYQLALIGRGVTPAKLHPLFPSHLSGDPGAQEESR